MALPNAPIINVYYGKPILPEVSRVLACLYEKDFVRDGFQNVQNLPVDLIRLQASTSVPAPFFEDGSKFLFESRAICRYISETYADRGNRYLLGRDLLDRVSIEQWLMSEEHSFDPPSRALVLHLAFSPPSKSYNLLEESERLAEILDVYNHRLGESRYLAGDEFTLADLTHLPNSQYIATSEDWGHLFHERENVKRWWDEVSARPSWANVVDDIRRSKEEEEEEETSIERKMSLKASIFQPIEAIMDLPVNTSTTFTLSKNVANPRGPMQVSVPSKRGFLVSVPDKNGAHIETTKIQSQPTSHIKEQVADAKVTMEESYIPPTNKQISPTDCIDKASTEPKRIGSQSAKPVADAKVTIEGYTVPATSAHVPSTDSIDKARTEPKRVGSQSTKPVTDAKVTIEGYTVPATSTHVPSTDSIDKATKPTGAIPQTTKPVTASKASEEKTFPPPTSRVPPTPETTPQSADETSAKKSHGLTSRQKLSLTTKTEQQTKLSPDGTQTIPSEKTTTKPQSKEQDQTHCPPTGTTVPPAHEVIESAKVTKMNTASPTDETSMNKSRGLPFTQAPLPASETVHPRKLSLEGTHTPPTEKTTTKPLTREQGQNSATETKRGETGEELTNTENETEIDAEAYLSAKHKEWNEQWQKPEKFGEQKHTDSIPVQKPKPPRVEDGTPSTTPTPTKSSDMTRQNPVTSKSTDAQVKEPSESRTTTKPKDATPTSIQDPSRGKTNGVPQEGTTASTTQTHAAKTTPQTVSAEPATDKSMAGSAKEPSESKVPVPEEKSNHGWTSVKPQERTPETYTTQKNTDPDATQLPPSSTNGTAGGPADKTNNVLVESRAANIPTATAEPTTNKPNTLPSPETMKRTVSVTEESSRDSSTNEPKDMRTLAIETETPIRRQTLSATTQITPTNEAAAGTTDVSRSKKVPAELQEASSGTKKGNDLAQNSQTDTQRVPPAPVAEDTSKGSSTNKPEDMPALGAETETTRKSQPVPTNEAAAGTRVVSQSKKVPAELKEASARTKSDNVLAQNSQADAQNKDISQGSSTDKPKETAELAAVTETTRKSQTPPTEETAAATTDVSQPKKVPAELKEASVRTKSDNVLAQNSQADTQKTPPAPAIEDISQGSSTNKPKEMAKLAAETETTRKSQTPPTEKTAAATTDVSQSKKVPADELQEATASTKSGSYLAQNSQAGTQKTPPVPATEDISRGSSTEKPNEMPKLGAETETTRKSQTPPTEKTAAATTDVSQSKKVPADELQEATASTKSGSYLAQNSQAGTQKTPPVPATEDISRGSSTEKPNEMPKLGAETETTRKSQTPPTEKTAAATTDVSPSKKVPADELQEATASTKSGSYLAQNSQAGTQKTPPVPATEDISRGSSTEKPNEMPKLGAETEPTRKSQTPPTKQAAAGTTDVSQSEKEPTELKRPAAGTSSGNDLAQNSQTDTHMAPPVDVATPKSQVSLDSDKQYSIDEAGTEKTKGEVSSRQSPFSTNQKGGELSPVEKFSSKITDPASDGSSTTIDTTRSQQETQNITEMGTKTEPGQLDTNEPNLTPAQSNKTDDAKPKNETLSEMKQNLLLPQDKETDSSNESPPEVRNEQNEPDSTNIPGRAKKE